MECLAKRIQRGAFVLTMSVLIILLCGYPVSAQVSPPDVSAFETTVSQLRQSQQYDQIVRVCNELLPTITDNPYRLRILQALAENYIETSHGLEAADTIARIRKEHTKTAGVTKSLCEVGDAYHRIKDFSAAQAIYDELVAKSGADPYSMWAQKNLCEMYAALGKVAETEQAITKLTAQYSGHPEYAQALCDAADACFKAKRTDRAIELYEYLVANHASVEHIIWAQKNRCLIHAERKESAELETQIDQLEKTFQTNPFLGQALNEVGDALHAAQNIDRAKQIFQQVASRYPMSKSSLWAGQKLIVLAIEESEKTNSSTVVPAGVLSAIDSMIKAHPGFEDLAAAVFMTGETYYTLGLEDCHCKPKVGNEDKLSKSITVWKKIVEGNMPYHKTFTPHAWFFTAVCYTHLGDDAAGIPYLQKVIDSWPDYEYAWNAQSWLGGVYLRLKNTNKLPPSEGNRLATEAYLQLLEKYPHCPMAYAACWQLGELGFQESRWDQAVDFYGQFIQTGKDDPRIPKAYYRLGQSYERLGQPENARQIYEEALTKFGSNQQITERLNALKGGVQ